MGYTDGQLMKQVAVSFLPSSLGGSALGMVLGYLNINRLSSLMFERLGISRLELTENPIALVILGLIIVLFSYGAEQEAPQTALYGIGSTSKVVTAAAVMKLAGEGEIDLDRPLNSYIPEFSMADDRYALITPRMLLNHTSGIPGSTLNNAMLLGDPDTDNHDRLLERLKTQRLKADPEPSV